jgi:hypothetical protein
MKFSSCEPLGPCHDMLEDDEVRYNDLSGVSCPSWKRLDVPW